MTCRRVFYGLLAALLGYVAVTVAAFVYLRWWQAVLASALTIALMVLGAKLLVRAAVGRLGELAKGLFDAKSRVLRDAAVDVHAVRPAGPPAGSDRAEAATDLQTLRWYEVEATIFPAAPTGPLGHWDVDDLRLVPADASPPALFAGPDATDGGFELHDLRLVEGGEAVEPGGTKPAGPQRLRFTVGLPPDVRAAKFRYFFEQFGHVPLPAPALPGGRP